MIIALRSSDWFNKCIYISEMCRFKSRSCTCIQEIISFELECLNYKDICLQNI